MGIKDEYLVEIMTEFGECIDKLLNDKDWDAYEVAAFSSLMLGVIHPFTEGNGRTSRLLMNYILIKRGLTSKNLDDELIDLHLDTGIIHRDVEIDTTRTFGKTIVDFTSLLDKKVEETIDDFVFKKYKEEGYFTMYPPGISETKVKVIKAYINEVVDGKMTEIPKIKEMSEIIRNLPNNK